MRKQNIVKKGLLLFSAIVMLSIAFVIHLDTTIAWLYEKGLLTNNFFAPVVDITIIEKEENDLKNFQIRNDSNVPVYVRIEAIGSLVNGDGALVSSMNVGQKQDTSDFTITIDEQKNWVIGSDGYYYYKNLLKVDKTTESVFSTYTVSDTTYSFHLNLYAQAIQAGDVTSAWTGVSVKDDGTLVPPGASQ